MKQNILDIKGILVGQAENEIGKTGVTVVIVPDGAVCGVCASGPQPQPAQNAVSGSSACHWPGDGRWVANRAACRGTCSGWRRYYGCTYRKKYGAAQKCARAG